MWVLLFHSHVRFLSKGRVLELSKEVLQFLQGRKHLSDPKFNINLAYMSYILRKLNDVNLTMYCPKVTIADAYELVSDSWINSCWIKGRKGFSKLVQFTFLISITF